MQTGQWGFNPMDRLQDFAGEADRNETVADDTAGDATVETALGVGTDERRMHVRAYNYWVSLLGGRAYPSVDDLSLDNLSDFGPHSVLLDFTASDENPAVAWLGEKLRLECGLPATVASVSEVPARSLLSRLTDHHMQIIANRAPIGFEAEFVSARGANAMYRGILLPFSSDGETIDYIYGVINWKEAASETEIAGLSRELMASAAETSIRPSPASPLAKRPMLPAWADGPSERTAERAEPDDGAPDDEAPDDEAGASVSATDGSLTDWLATARAHADAALTADTRGRATLYRALAGAYDFALIAEGRDDEYAALLAQSRIDVQARAPMTPVVKLIFGKDYDKTRLTEFAAALMFARRRQLPAGGMKLFLENFPGGLKAIVAAERRERRPDDKPIKPDLTRDAARALAEQAYLTLSGEDEFVILVARRVDSERVAIIGVVPDDKPMLDRALRQIVG